MGKKGGDDHPVRKKRQGDRKSKERKYKNYVGDDRRFKKTYEEPPKEGEEPDNNNDQNNQLVQNET